ncbi:T9SS type A sorting domain-containing protein [candidate division WOR-3 bacterium]|nr:T9SS type A sorting domain-containing protein [candidate division WOR-3 bacterium]
MLALLVSLSFNFDSITSPQFAGDSFRVSISAIDSSSFLCSLSVEPTYCSLAICGKEDNRIKFENGKWDGWINILYPLDSICLCCSHLESEEFSLSNKFTIKSKTILSQLRQTGDSIYIYPNPLTNEYSSTSINYHLSQNAHVLIMIFDKFGNPVWDTEADETAGMSNIDWDGTDSDGNRVSSGVYIVCIKATNQTQTVGQYTGKIAVIR